MWWICCHPNNPSQVNVTLAQVFVWLDIFALNQHVEMDTTFDSLLVTLKVGVHMILSLHIITCICQCWVMNGIIQHVYGHISTVQPKGVCQQSTRWIILADERTTLLLTVD